MSKTYRAHSKYFGMLALTATPQEVAQLWDRSYSGVIYHIMADHFAAVKMHGGGWSVCVPSVVAFWGPPTSPFGRFSDTNVTQTALQIIEEKHDNRTGEQTRRADRLDPQMPGMPAGISQQTSGRGDVQQRLPTKIISQTAAQRAKKTP